MLQKNEEQVRARENWRRGRKGEGHRCNREWQHPFMREDCTNSFSLLKVPWCHLEQWKREKPSDWFHREQLRLFLFLGRYKYEFFEFHLPGFLLWPTLTFKFFFIFYFFAETLYKMVWSNDGPDSVLFGPCLDIHSKPYVVHIWYVVYKVQKVCDYAFAWPTCNIKSRALL